MKKQVLLLTGCCAFFAATAQETTFRNPVIRGDVADPTIIHVGKNYYAAGTSSEWAPYYPLFVSQDLVNWQPIGHLFDRQPEWTVSSFWAPELYYDGKQVYLYYTARRKSDNVSYIGVATAEKPEGPFTDHGPIITYGTEAIDAFVIEDQGERYISWKAYGLDKRPIEILGCKLSADGLRLEGEPFSLLRDDERRGMEGQHWLKKGDYYYLVYAVNGCCGPQSDYAVAVARSKNLKGPYEKYDGNPILHGGDEIQSCGHGTITTTDDGRMFYLCHAYLKGGEFFCGRQPILQELVLGEDGWLHFKSGETATLTQPLPFASTIQEPVQDFYDAFGQTTLRKEWSWNYPYSEVACSVSEGRLALSGTPKGSSVSGAALCLRPVTAHTRFETAVVWHDGKWCGIALYGDDRNLLSMGIENNQLRLKTVLDGKLEYSEPLADIPDKQPVCLRMEMHDGKPSAFAYSLDGQVWKPVNLPDREGKGFIQWDRVARPGLYTEGKAEYEYASLRNLE